VLAVFFGAEGFSVGVLYGGLGISKLKFLIKKYKFFLSCKIFLLFFVIKTLDPELDPDSQLEKMLDPHPHSIDVDLVTTMDAPVRPSL
jgi:hypothetical protein